MKVYGIWYADYSNSHTGGGVYTNRDDAVAVCLSARDGEEASVEEFELDPPLDESVEKLRRSGESFFWVGMDIDGDNSQANEDLRDTTERTSVRVWKGTLDRFNSHTWATDEKHAIKIVNERRTRWIANGSFHGSNYNDYGWVTLEALNDS